MPLELPIRTLTGVQRYPITIEGVSYFLRVKYFPRTESVYLDVDDADEEQIVAGVRCVFGFPFTIYNRDPRLPSGTFSMVRNTSTADRCAFAEVGVDVLRTMVRNTSTADRCAFAEVGVDVRLYHWTDEELQAEAVEDEAPAITVEPIP